MIHVGSSDHQHILQVLVDVCKNDATIDAFCVFGSPVRGDWNTYSDVDVDAVVTDASTAKIHEIVAALSKYLSNAGLKTLLHFEESHNQWVFLLQNLERMCILFHT